MPYSTNVRFDGRELRVRLAKKDEARLSRLARAYEMTESEVVRRLIADGARALRAASKG